MKTKRLIIGLFVSVVAVGSVVGCATTGYEKAASTATALNRSAEITARGNVLIDETLSTLNDLVLNPNLDLRKQFKAFNSAVNELGLTARDVTVKDEQMKLQGAAYFKDWDKEMAMIKNEDIRHRSEARKNEVAAQFDRITQRYDAAKAAFIPYMSDLRDVQKFLSVDLTSGGLSAIKDVAARATSHAVPLKDAISKLSVEFQDLGVSMSSKTAIK
ncbi:MAG: DUF2959 family protein [Candidatus Omnitrophica bacterium]|nr:DUF2959 family protein [Candidatus Omnitrophota bacterium]